MSAVTHPLSVTRAAPAEWRAAPSPLDVWGRRLAALVVICWGASPVIGLRSALAILALIGFTAAVLGTFRPWAGLLGIGILCTLDPLLNSFLFTGGLLPWNTLNYFLLLLALSSVALLIRQDNVQLRLLVLLAALLSTEVLLSPDWYRGLEDVVGMAAPFGLLVYFARTREQGATWYWQGLICGTTGAAGGIVFLADPASMESMNRNAWAFFPLTALFAICLAFPHARTRRGQAALATLASVNYAWVFLSASRGTLLTATACVLCLLLLTHRVRGRWLLVCAAALVTVTVTTQFTDLETKTVGRFRLLLDPEVKAVGRTSGRSALFASGWSIFVEHPLGVGTGGFAVARVEQNLARGRFSGWRSLEQRAAHSGWIKILAENGLPGITLLGAYVLSFAVTGWRARNREVFVLGLIATLGLGSGLISTEYQTKGLWFLAAGVMVLLRPGGALARHAVRPT